MLAFSDIWLISGISMVTALLGVVFCLQKRSALTTASTPHPEPLSLLFDDGMLEHANTAALHHFTMFPGLHSWTDLRERLEPHFPEIPEAIGPDDRGKMTMFAQDKYKQSQLDLRWRDNLCWVSLSDTDGESPARQDPALAGEIDVLRVNCKTTPNAVWHLNKSGAVVWSNDQYDRLAKEYAASDATSLFPAAQPGDPQRASIKKPGSDRAHWYEITSFARRNTTINHATCINALVEAEVAQRNFVQTLAKTFAHLSIGLAIFDRNGQLVLFNPALIDLTGLSAPYLSAGPTMLSFFDQLRENRQMPEPKNYLNWRQEISAVIAAAADGKYQEVWSLENGRTYSVLGRPHPDGATAFLIEDISAEVTLTRNFRTELELSQSILDTVKDAIVVFSSAGILNFCNAAYRDLWGQNPEGAFADVTIHDCIKVWEAAAEYKVPWDHVENHVMDFQNRNTLHIPFSLADGQEYVLELQSISPDAAMLKFAKARPHRSTAPALEAAG